VNFARYPPRDPQHLLGYAESIAKFSHSKELRAALRMFL
jgi:hypothetical protein